jgi:hypothetical protein
VADIAVKTGKGRSTVARDVTRAKKVAVLDDIAGTCLQSEILIQRTFKPATLQARGCRKGCRGSHESRIAELTAEVALHFWALGAAAPIIAFVASAIHRCRGADIAR